jgi:tight adherence protein C
MDLQIFIFVIAGFGVMVFGLVWVLATAVFDEKMAIFRFKSIESARPTTVGVSKAADTSFKGRLVLAFRRAGFDAILGTERLSRNLVKSGARGRDALTAVLFMKIMAPPAGGWFVWQFDAASYLVEPLHQHYDDIRMGAAALFGFVCFYVPDFIVSLNVKERKQAIRSGLPDTVDLLYICVQAGMTLEAALLRITGEVERRSPEIADELRLLSAELSYLSDRRIAYENFRLRCDVEEVNELILIIQQSERYGTALGDALRQVAVETRARQIMDIERRALQLPGKLAVPIMGFLLPGVVMIMFAPMMLGGFGF